MCNDDVMMTMMMMMMMYKSVFEAVEVFR